MSAASRSKSGLPLALAAYTIWGFLPLYIALLEPVPALELVAWRVIFTLPLCLAIAYFRRQLAEVARAFADFGVLRRLLASALLIAVNWVVYIAAVNGGHIYAASLGYYINPLVNVLLGTLFLGERLNRPQWFAVALAGVGVAVLLYGATDTLWVSLVLWLSFGLYGLVRKLAPVEPLAGLAVETGIAAPVAVIYLLAVPLAQGRLLAGTPRESLLLLCSGLVTALPLLWFAIGAKRLRYSTLGIIQYLAPTCQLALAVLAYGEPFTSRHAVTFLLIWTAVLMYAADSVRGGRTPQAPVPAASRGV